MKTISSRQNPLVRAFRDLADSPDPSGTRVLLDGAHLVHDAWASDAVFEVVAVEEARLDSDSEAGELARALERDGVEVVATTGAVFAAMSPVRTPSGIAAIAIRRAADAAEICQHPSPFILAIVDVQDPGNVGSVLRAAEAGGVTGAFVASGSANPFSWKALRGSMGSALRLPVVTGLAPAALVTCMKTSGLRVVASVARDGDDPDAVDWRGKVGVLLGGEGPGLSDDLVAQCDARVTIPMAPPVDSLNVATAAAILIYAARRQRTGTWNAER